MQYEALRSLRIIRGLLASNPETKEQLEKVDQIIAALPDAAAIQDIVEELTDANGRGDVVSTLPADAIKNAETESEYLLNLLKSLRRQEQAQLPKGVASSNLPSEVLYCTCNKPATGDMVACDAEGCPYEWYHFECVQLTGAPMGVWYCPFCRERFGGSRKRRR